ncbi:hypothetical protein HaLaN_24302, partial [Haematococcus lacustris]
DIMFDQKIGVEGEDGGIHLPFSKTIFVMEGHCTEWGGEACAVHGCTGCS